MAIAPLISAEIIRRVISTRRVTTSDPTDTGGPDVSRQLSDQQLLSTGVVTRSQLVAHRRAFFDAQRTRPTSGRRLLAGVLSRYGRLGRVPRWALRAFVSLRPPRMFTTSLAFLRGEPFRSGSLARMVEADLDNLSLPERLEAQS